MQLLPCASKLQSPMCPRLECLAGPSRPGRHQTRQRRHLRTNMGNPSIALLQACHTHHHFGECPFHHSHQVQLWICSAHLSPILHLQQQNLQQLHHQQLHPHAVVAQHHLVPIPPVHNVQDVHPTQTRSYPQHRHLQIRL